LRLDFRQIEGLENRVILCNPPYGIRMKRQDGLEDFYRQLGDFLKQRCKGSEAYIYFGNREMIKRIGLKPAWKKPLRNGGLDGRVVKYEMY
jgi:putative N6-adenine-specific DNA methylase